MHEIIATNLIISDWSGDNPVLGFEDNWAIEPKIVLSPVDTTIPLPVPLTQKVPCIAIQELSK